MYSTPIVDVAIFATFHDVIYNWNEVSQILEMKRVSIAEEFAEDNQDELLTYQRGNKLSKLTCEIRIFIPFFSNSSQKRTFHALFINSS